MPNKQALDLAIKDLKDNHEIYSESQCESWMKNESKNESISTIVRLTMANKYMIIETNKP